MNFEFEEFSVTELEERVEFGLCGSSGGGGDDGGGGDPGCGTDIGYCDEN